MAESQLVAIVTGGAQGLGAAISVELLKLGYKVCVADIQELKGKCFVEDQQKQYGSNNIIFSLCDVSKESDFKSTFYLALKVFNKVDLLINNAGIILSTDAMRILQVNLLGTINGCQTALKYMGMSSGGKGGMVINTASAAGLLPVPVHPIYSASKHGVVGLTRSYGTSLYSDKEGILFAGLCPSMVNTEMFTSIKELNLLGDSSKRWSAVMSTEYVTKGVIKILKDRINGSILLVTPDGYKYVGYPEELKDKILPQ